LWAAAHRSRKIIAVSEATRADLQDVYSLPANRIAVIPHGVNPEFLSVSRTRTEPYVLCVSTLHPHKNLERLIRAFHAARSEYQLVLAGVLGFRTKAIEDLITDLGLRDSVKITGWLPRTELLKLYDRAHAFVYPSTFEGFGMPVLEALAAGIPTACSSIPPLREVAGDAAVFFEPSEDAAIVDALRRITSDQELRTTLSAAGPERARSFTWKRSAEMTVHALLAH
jgi:glycosyltransferase involved in cell wall biosynthesis